MTASSPLLDEKTSDKRTLFLFALSKNEPRLVQQQKYLAEDLEGQTERNLFIPAPIMVADISRQAGNPEGSYIENSEIKFPLINIRNPFCAILVGKDGSEKLRTYEPISLKKLYALIDKMPMRIEEMKMAVKP